MEQMAELEKLAAGRDPGGRGKRVVVFVRPLSVHLCIHSSIYPDTHTHTLFVQGQAHSWLDFQLKMFMEMAQMLRPYVQLIAAKRSQSNQSCFEAH